MDDEKYTDINGKPIALDYQRHLSFCTEFIVSSPKVSIGKVVVATCFVWIFAYAVFCFTDVRHTFISTWSSSSFLTVLL